MYKSKIGNKPADEQSRVCAFGCSGKCYMTCEGTCDDSCKAGCEGSCEIFNGSTAIEDPMAE